MKSYWKKGKRVTVSCSGKLTTGHIMYHIKAWTDGEFNYRCTSPYLLTNHEDDIHTAATKSAKKFVKNNHINTIEYSLNSDQQSSDVSVFETSTRIDKANDVREREFTKRVLPSLPVKDLTPDNLKLLGQPTTESVKSFIERWVDETQIEGNDATSLDSSAGI
ncbi:uncharacterized protein LOC130628814 isoform X2 [Hydractinia symbiolongicarpus]|uniref:uncharacterized protein LOC130628814 isoform X2 n=1 Tax=Hydractinia symbiolongicarpus TaxID=13093 RepID=UPI00254A80A0|nr:uncharacterized protein LOC130628814 isoform X2 [Hydractinia symbiolongicarpus]